MGNFNAESAGHNNRPIQHVHEVIGSTFIAERCNDPHNHRIAAVSGKAIPFMDSHVHNITFRTDSYDGHYHEFCGTSSPGWRRQTCAFCKSIYLICRRTCT